MRPRGCRLIRTTFPSAWTSRCRRQWTAQRRRHGAAPTCSRAGQQGLEEDVDLRRKADARLRIAVPKMLIQVGGSISFAPEGEGEEAKSPGIDTRHVLAS